jgi:hypothetical protein
VLTEISTLAIGLDVFSRQCLGSDDRQDPARWRRLTKRSSSKKARLNELFQIEAEAVSLDDIKAQKQAEVTEWISVSKKSVRPSGAEEVASERDKQWKREQEQHDYSVTQSRRRSADEFAAEVARNKRAEEVRHLELVQEWTERETGLKNQVRTSSPRSKNKSPALKPVSRRTSLGRKRSSRIPCSVSTSTNWP